MLPGHRTTSLNNGVSSRDTTLSKVQQDQTTRLILSPNPYGIGAALPRCHAWRRSFIYLLTRSIVRRIEHR